LEAACVSRLSIGPDDFDLSRPMLACAAAPARRHLFRRINDGARRTPGPSRLTVPATGPVTPPTPLLSTSIQPLSRLASTQSPPRLLCSLQSHPSAIPAPPFPPRQSIMKQRTKHATTLDAPLRRRPFGFVCPNSKKMRRSSHTIFSPHHAVV
jgi:hypothetical protein